MPTKSRHTKTALIIPLSFDRFSYGNDHPFNLQRYNLAWDLMSDYGLLQLPYSELRNCKPLTRKQILTFHDENYIEHLEEFSRSADPRADFRFGLGDADCPVFQGLYDYAALGSGATFEAVRLVANEGFDCALNLAGGWHHAHCAKAAGFSYLNDAVIAIKWLVKKGKRVVYLDIDAHHGDGVQEGFYDTDQVLTISLHESGIYFFPGTGFENELGINSGYGYSVNIPLLAHTDDAIYMKAFDEIAYPLIAAYNPDIIVTQIGADSFRTDPLTNLEITTHSYSYIMRKIKALKIPWVALGGGGYDIMNTARAWVIAWSIMNDIELPHFLPEKFVHKIAALGYPHKVLWDAMHWADEQDRILALDAVEDSIRIIRKTVFKQILGS